jgi:dTDP-glucose pyrophosphorylase/CBS domain-containing protein
VEAPARGLDGGREVKGLERATININADIRAVMELINRNSLQIALVVDDGHRFLGTITDGDIRRGLLAGLGLQSPIGPIVNRDPTVASVNDAREEILNLATAKSLNQIPIVDQAGVLVGLETVEDLVKRKARENPVVIMAGGLGTRLGELTRNTPKPMLHVGNKPILLTIIESFAKYGFTNIVLCVNYKSDVIENYFKDGSSFGVNITYVHEEKRMGTAGALGLLSKAPDKPFFVMNGDILTNINFENLLAYHVGSGSPATMSVRLYDLEVPYGVVYIKDSRIGGISEKPVHQFFVNAGIYVLNPECIELIPKGQFFDMTTLFQKLVDGQRKPSTYLISEYWLDVGHAKDYQAANEEYHGVF